jgi:IclR family acetate operon transcriptional repressor
VYVAQVPSKHSMRMFTEVGRRLLPHGTGVGKAMLAQLPRAEVLALLERTGLPAYTPNTITDTQELMDSLDQITEQGYALDESEQELGVRCIAVPLIGAPTLSAVSVSGPEGRLTHDAVARILPEVLGIAKRLTDQASIA